ncbi:MAG: bifunctional methylenetetrahydrofolate dehydrogenase/methenyltetrahydrofolate cyclohydrolase FolD [Deltaproteobacteria bacterium]|nr:bifunctional methylenetetrahydrofolate dehydrogenase/methenyltetrahydrofolate cyclohydrolase FolD [Deltaproteobacteria bacterium]MBI4373351.1 bifunctional methylenetetrahydrofolate dehydrogenase/methenyltetrahydrofolate cyclohydrolase FolD [Deltaproteobacteria bacterium]
MPAKIINGKQLAEKIRKEIAEGVAALRKKKGIVPGLATILVGENEASKIYVRNKEIACREAGMFAVQHLLPVTTTEPELLSLISKLNTDPKIHGILIQLPMPITIDEKKILEAVAPEKDVDGFHPINMGWLLEGKGSVIPCTPFGVIKILESIDYPIEGKEAVIVGRSKIVGKPVAILLLERNATVTLCHSRTKNLGAQISRADIVIVAVGRPGTIRGSWIKPGSVVIDVGISRDKDGKVVGDVEFEPAKERAGWITPVPGGVGPMTIAMLLWNTLEAAKRA